MPPSGLLISANGNSILPVDQAKKLEVILDSFLSLNSHIQIVVKKLIGSILSQPPMLPPHLTYNSGLDYCTSLLTLPIPLSLPSSHS